MHISDKVPINYYYMSNTNNKTNTNGHAQYNMEVVCTAGHTLYVVHMCMYNVHCTVMHACMYTEQCTPRYCHLGGWGEDGGSMGERVEYWVHGIYGTIFIMLSNTIT